MPVANLIAISNGQKRGKPGRLKDRIVTHASSFEPMDASELKNWQHCGK
jgi:hypothetical protein